MSCRILSSAAPGYVQTKREYKIERISDYAQLPPPNLFSRVNDKGTHWRLEVSTSCIADGIFQRVG